MKLKFLAHIVVITFFVISPAAVQAQPSSIINAANIRQLQSVAHIDFDDLPEEAGKVENGWFALTPDGNHFAMLNREYGVVLWNITSGFLKLSIAECNAFGSGSFVDGAFGSRLSAFNSEERFWWFITVSQALDGYIVGYHRLNGSPGKPTVLCSTAEEIPIRVWGSQIGRGGYNWLETIPVDTTTPSFVLKFPILVGVDPNSGDMPNIRIPSGPENDTDSLLRIGRIDPPLAITVTQDALLKRWNLETGEVTATAQIDSLPAAGQVNPDGTSLAWVDQKFESLHLLNFEIDMDKVIASLNGTYIPFLLLSAQADVIIGVNVGLEPDVVAWDVATGARIDLGEYRPCNRQPDRVRLSRDGSTLVIGCDTGLDIWRIPVNN